MIIKNRHIIALEDFQDQKLKAESPLIQIKDKFNFNKSEYPRKELNIPTKSFDPLNLKNQ